MRMLARHARIAALSLAVASLALVTGCGKDEPAPQQPAPQQPTPGAPAGDAQAGQPGQPGQAPQPGTQPGAATGAPQVVGAPTSPESVVLVAGMPSLDGALGDFQRIGNAIAPGQLPPNLSSMAVENIKQQLGVTDIAWLDRAAPIKMVVVNPKQYANGALLVLPAADRDKVLASLPAAAQRDQGGHAATYEHRFSTWYVDFVEGAAVFSQHADVFAQVKDYVGGGLRTWTPGTPIAVQVNMENVNRLFGAEIDDFERMLKQTYSQMQQDEDVPGANLAMQQNVEAIFAFLDQTRQLDFSVAAPADALQVGMGVSAKQGTALAQFITESAASEPTLTSLAPATSWLGFAGNMDTRKVEALKTLQQSSVATYAQLLKMTPEEQQQLRGLLEQAWEVSTGDSVFSIYTDGRFPLAMVSAARVTDSAKAKQTYDQLFALLFKKGWALLKAEMEKEGVQLPATVQVNTFSDLAKLATEMGTQYGLSMQVVEQKEGDATVEAVKINIDWDKTPLRQEDPETYAIMKDVVGNNIELAMAFQGQMTSMALGPNAIRQAAAAVGTPPATGGEATLTQAARGNLFAMALRIGAALEAFSFVPELQAQRAAIAALPKDKSFVVAGDSNGQALAMSIILPTDLIRALAQMGNEGGAAPTP